MTHKLVSSKAITSLFLSVWYKSANYPNPIYRYLYHHYFWVFYVCLYPSTAFPDCLYRQWRSRFHDRDNCTIFYLPVPSSRTYARSRSIYDGGRCTSRLLLDCRIWSGCWGRPWCCLPRFVFLSFLIALCAIRSCSGPRLVTTCAEKDDIYVVFVELVLVHALSFGMAFR